MIDRDKRQLELQFGPCSIKEHSIKLIDKSGENTDNVISLNEEITKRIRDKDARIYSNIASLVTHLY